MSGPGRRTGVLRLAAAIVLGGVLVGAATLTDVAFGTREAGPSDRTTMPSADERASYLTDALLACPGAGDHGEVDDPPDGTSPSGPDGAGRGTWLRVASAPQELFGQGPGPVGAGSVQLDVVGPQGLADRTGFEADEAGSRASILEQDEWVVLRGEEDHAPGMVGAQLTFVPQPGGRGLTLTPCSSPADVVHLLGGGAGAGRVEQVVLTNPTSDPVTVDLEVFGVDGQARTVGGSGLVVPAQGRLVQRLDALAPSAEHPVVRVSSRGGPVVAHLAERHREGTTDLGTAMVAGAAAPARELVVPALPVPQTGEARVSLRLLAPEGAAVVELRALTSAGAYLPGTAVVRVGAGSTVEVLLEDLPEGASALRLWSDAPVTAGALVQVAPDSDEPVDLDDGLGPVPDAATTTTGPDDEASTAGPDDEASTAGPEDQASTAGPDTAAATADPAPPTQAEPVVRPAGESAWVAAVPLSRVPLGIAVPDLAELPDPDAALAVSVVDGTTVQVLWLDDRGVMRSEELTLPNDTTRVLEVRRGTAAVWVLPTADVGVAAALHVGARDSLGPYLGSSALPAVPWTREVPDVVQVLP